MQTCHFRVVIVEWTNVVVINGRKKGSPQKTRQRAHIKNGFYLPARQQFSRILSSIKINFDVQGPLPKLWLRDTAPNRPQRPLRAVHKFIVENVRLNTSINHGAAEEKIRFMGKTENHFFLAFKIPEIFTWINNMFLSFENKMLTMDRRGGKIDLINWIFTDELPLQTLFQSRRRRSLISWWKLIYVQLAVI